MATRRLAMHKIRKILRLKWVLVDELTMARAGGSLPRLLAKLARMDLLILDDWGITPLRDQDRRDLMEVIEDRDGTRSTLVTSRIPVVQPTRWRSASAYRPTCSGSCAVTTMS